MIRVTTETGSRYEIEGAKIRRVNTSAEKRGDGLWLQLANEPIPIVGQPMVLILESLSAMGPDDSGAVVPGGVTLRRTSWVTAVEND